MLQFLNYWAKLVHVFGTVKAQIGGHCAGIYSVPIKPLRNQDQTAQTEPQTFMGSLKTMNALVLTATPSVLFAGSKRSNLGSVVSKEVPKCRW